ncbi:MAG: Ig-like domain-containing protein [Bacteroidales bacterium]|nr:Ig-like domain-containing protein [Bacteroidales bacterium]
MIRKLKYLIVCSGLLLTAFLAQRCANAVAPTGGPKDSTPPVVVEAVPENLSVNFIGKKVEITFNEYITLENANQNVLISPPLSEKPDIKLKNKTVVIKFKEILTANTTYTIDFGNAIKDLHEGNPFKDYVYSFSTGDFIDTLSIAGKVLNAEDKKPVENAYVSLYAADRENLDSLPLTTVPNYITKTDKEGRFNLNGLANKEYLVFALKDVNSNLYFDLPNEEVAFLDSLVPASYPWTAPPPQPLDSTTIDSLAMQMDTIAIDTIAKPKDSLAFETMAPTMYDQNSLDLTLLMFTEVDSTQVLLEKKLVEEGLLRFAFRHPAKEAVVMTPEMLPDTFNLVTTHSAEYDTVLWYFTPNVKDSLWVQVKYDTLINDSSRYSLKFKESKNARRNREPEKLKVTNNLIGRGGLIPKEDLILKFSEPIVRYEMPDSTVFKCDTIVFYGKLAFEPVDEEGFEYRLTTPFSADSSYSFELPDSVFFGIRGRTNGPIKVDFHVMNDDEYGNIYITVTPPEGMKQVVVQLTNESGKVLRQEVITNKQEVMFDYLTPAKYKLRTILDTDGNGKWSTGNYHHRLLPETILEYKDPLEIRAGWDIDLEEVWELKKP